jgi:hypothetical protein
LTTGEIQARLAEVYDAEVSRQTTSTYTYRGLILGLWPETRPYRAAGGRVARRCKRTLWPGSDSRP